MGYTQSELNHIQNKWKLRFPPDLVELMRERRPLRPGGFDWLKTPQINIKRAINWPYAGFLSDVEGNDLWWPEWGDKPASRSKRAQRLQEVFAKTPKLIPLAGHRYLPEMPYERSNPVFSVFHSDVICYGADLADWIVKESPGLGPGRTIDPQHPPKEIPFWSEVVRRNG